MRLYHAAVDKDGSQREHERPGEAEAGNSLLEDAALAVGDFEVAETALPTKG